MADGPSTNLDTISPTQAGKEVTANEIFDAASPSTFGGRHASASSLLTWAYYGGKFNVSGTITNIANGSVPLTASTTNYIEIDTSGTVHVNTTGFTGGRFPLYSVVTGATAVTSWTDERLSAIGPSPSSGMSNPMTTAGDLIVGGSSGTPQRLGIGATNQILSIASGAEVWQSRGMPSWNHQTGTSYTAALTDDGAGVRADNTAANAVTVPPHSSVAWNFPGSILYLAQWNTGQSSFAAGSEVTLNNASSLNCRAQYSIIYAIATDVTDTWIVAGDMA